MTSFAFVLGLVSVLAAIRAYRTLGLLGLLLYLNGVVIGLIAARHYFHSSN